MESLTDGAPALPTIFRLALPAVHLDVFVGAVLVAARPKIADVHSLLIEVVVHEFAERGGQFHGFVKEFFSSLLCLAALRTGAGSWGGLRRAGPRGSGWRRWRAARLTPCAPAEARGRRGRSDVRVANPRARRRS